MKGYTSLEQSKKLSEILQLETADMHYARAYFEGNESDWFIGLGKPIKSDDIIPCWSLAALFEQMPSEIKGHELTIRKSYWQIEKTFAYELSYEEDFEDYPPSILISTSSIELIDACCEMIIKLHELKRL